MASRTRVAATALAIILGVVVGGAGAAVAEADPDPGQGTETAGPQAASAATASAASSPGTGTSTDATSTVAGGRPSASGPLPGSGADGAVPSTGGTGSNTAARGRSKPFSDGRRRPPQTSDAAAEDLDPAGPVPSSVSKVEPTPTPTTIPVPSTALIAEIPEERWVGFWWPWWGKCPDGPGPHYPGPGLPPPGGGSGNGGGGPGTPPISRPPPVLHLPVPRDTPPDLSGISADPLADAAPGFPAGQPLAPIALPGIALPGGVAPIAGTGAGPRAGTSSAPVNSGASQTVQSPLRVGRQNPPVFGAGSGTPPESFRAGYRPYLRSAGVGDMMAVALPGLAGILVLTAAGGALGYRQARAVQSVRAIGAARFMG